MAVKNYIGGSFKKAEGQYGEYLLISVKVEDLAKIQNERGYANVMMTARRETDQYGNNMTMFESVRQDKQNAPSNEASTQKGGGKGDALPF